MFVSVSRSLSLSLSLSSVPFDVAVEELAPKEGAGGIGPKKPDKVSVLEEGPDLAHVVKSWKQVELRARKELSEGQVSSSPSNGGIQHQYLKGALAKQKFWPSGFWSMLVRTWETTKTLTMVAGNSPGRLR